MAYTPNNANGQAAMAASAPVVIASNQAAFPVTGPTADNASNPILKLGVLPAVALAAAPSRTEGNVNPLRLNLAGDLAVTLDGEAVVLGAGSASVGTVINGVGSATMGAVTGPTADNAANPILKLGVLAGVALAAAPTRTEGNVNPLRLNLAGDAAITLDGEAVVLGAGAAIVGALVANQSTNTVQLGGVAITLGSGVTGTGVQRVALATDVILAAQSEQRAAVLHVTATAAVNTALTLTLAAPAAGLFHYITSIELSKLFAVVGVASAAGVVITSTNLPGTPAWTTQQTASTLGTVLKVIDYEPTTPLRCAAAATATTIVAPAQAETIWRFNVSYFTAV